MHAPASSPPAPTRLRERTEPLRSSTPERVGGGVIAAASLAVLSIAAWLTPSGHGHGTHTQMGLPPCTWTTWFDKPCPTCGMTTSFATAGEGRWIESFLTQPAGMAFCVVTAAAFWMGMHTLVTGSRLGSLAGWLLKPRFATAIVLGVLAAWGYKILTW